MRGSTTAICWLLVLCGAMGQGQGQGQEGRGRRTGRLKQGVKSRCHYFCEEEVGPCDPDTNTQDVSFALKRGVNCPPFRNFTKPCPQGDDLESLNQIKGCLYDRRGSQWTPCGSGMLTKTKVMTLQAGQPPTCPPTKTKTVPCRKEGQRRKKGRNKGKNKGRNKGKKKVSRKDKKKGQGRACRYQRGPWLACDPATNERSRELLLKRGDPSACLPQKVITKKCGKACKYSKGPWSACNEESKEKTRQLTLRKGDPSVCNVSTTIVRPCRQRNAMTAANTSQCRYKPLAWTPCDDRTNTMTRRMELRSGDPALCQPIKELVRKCRKLCQFSKGEWTACDQQTGLKTRTDSLVKGAPANCEPTRVISTKCGDNDGCRYNMSDWGPCDEQTKERTRLKSLIEGDPDVCVNETPIKRPCYKRNGQENCFLGPWGEFGPCQNGVKIKRRLVMAGGMRCQRKAVKTRPC